MRAFSVQDVSSDLPIGCARGKGHLSRFCLVACLGKEIIASIRTTEITVGGARGALLLGPVAVDSDQRSLGLGSKLITAALEAARTGGAKLIVLVGDQPYYGRFGFRPVPPGQIVFRAPSIRSAFWRANWSRAPSPVIRDL